MNNENVDTIKSFRGLRELALFAGAGGGILGGGLLGWRTVCAVEIEPYPAGILCARQNDGILPPFPIWTDVRSFNGKPWRGIIDIVSGGFPCQDISAAGKGAGIDGARSGLWRECARIIGEVRPRLAYMENSPMLVRRGLARVLGDLAALGYDAEWLVMGADDVGAPHIRKRIWILAVDRDADRLDDNPLCAIPERTQAPDAVRVRGRESRAPDSGRDNILPHAELQRAGRREQFAQGFTTQDGAVSDAACERCQTRGQSVRASAEISQPRERGAVSDAEDARNVRRLRLDGAGEKAPSTGHHNGDGAQGDNVQWWAAEPDVGRMVDGLAARVDRIKALGNGQVPLVAAVAFRELYRRFFGAAA